MSRILINKYIVSDSDICHGKPTFKGTRVMVWQVLELLADGQTSREIMEAFPTLCSKHIKSALEYASSITQEHYAIINTSPERPKIPAILYY